MKLLGRDNLSYDPFIDSFVWTYLRGIRGLGSTNPRVKSVDLPTTYNEFTLLKSYDTRRFTHQTLYTSPQPSILTM